jgi:hypothetical protein
MIFKKEMWAKTFTIVDAVRTGVVVLRGLLAGWKELPTLHESRS